MRVRRVSERVFGSIAEAVRETHHEVYGYKPVNIGPYSGLISRMCRDDPDIDGVLGYVWEPYDAPTRRELRARLRDALEDASRCKSRLARANRILREHGLEEA
jgi:hypothetical protein